MNINELKGDIVMSLKTGNTDKVILPKMMSEWFGKLTHTELGVLIALYEFVNTITGSCFPSQETIGNKLGITRQPTISEALTGLQRKGLIRVAKAKQLKNGRLIKASNEIFIIPYEKVGDTAYLEQIDDMLERGKFVTVQYVEEGGKTFRKIVGTGENTNCKTPKEMDAFIEECRQRSIKEPEKRLPEPEEPDEVDFIIDEMAEEDVLDCDSSEIKRKLKEIVYKHGGFEVDTFDLLHNYKETCIKFTADVLVDLFGMTHTKIGG